MLTLGRKNYRIEIVVARHCSTILNEEGKFQGTSFDFPLTEKGQAEAQSLKKTFDKLGYRFDAVIASDTKRAKQTAEILVGDTCNKLIVDKRINPFDLGDADAKKEEELFTVCRFPILAKNKESLCKYLRRIREFLRDVFSTYNGKSVLVVTHEDICGVIDSYISNYFILKAPKNGLKNGHARVYHVWEQNVEREKDKKRDFYPQYFHFRGPNTNNLFKSDISPEKREK